MCMSTPKIEAPPPLSPPTPMPEPDDDLARKAKRRAAAESINRSGRLSTILTDGSNETLG